MNLFRPETLALKYRKTGKPEAIFLPHVNPSENPSMPLAFYLFDSSRTVWPERLLILWSMECLFFSLQLW